MVENKEAETKILKAKVKLQKTNPFFAYLIMNMKYKEVVDDKEMPSMAVDSKGNCYYNPKFVLKIVDEELHGVLAHEVMHIVLEHLSRGKKIECAELYNVACDMVINDILVTNGLSLPRFNEPNSVNLIPYNHMCSFMEVKVYDLDKKSAEQVYRELFKQLDKKGKIQYVGFDKHIQGDGKEKREIVQGNKDKWKRAVAEASAFARERGKLPQGMTLMIDELLNEKVDWKQLLYKYITRELPFDYTYSRPSKRSVSCGVYMPSILRESIEIVVSLDTSASISKQELTEFMTEIRGIAKSFNNLRMKIIICDSDIKEVYDVGNGHDDEISKIKITGGGGTSHKPIYDYLKENIPNTRLVINFTDGYTDYPAEEEIRTLWVLCANGCQESALNWGEVIKLK